MRKQYKSHQSFHIARKTLTDGELHATFGRSTRYMQMWAADPRYCEVVRRNVLDQMREFLNSLDDHGRADEDGVIETVELIRIKKAAFQNSTGSERTCRLRISTDICVPIFSMIRWQRGQQGSKEPRRCLDLGP